MLILRYNKKFMKIFLTKSCLSFLTAVLTLAVFNISICFAAEFEAAVYFSDGTVKSGQLSIPANKPLKLNMPDSGDIYTSDMVTGEPVRYGRVKKIYLDSISKIEFFLQKQEMLRKWKFISQTHYDPNTAEADYTPAEKEYSGEPYPLIYLAASITANSGELFAGHLYSTALYLKTADSVEKLPLLSKVRGKQGQSLDDLVYITCIKFIDPANVFSEFDNFTLNNFKLKNNDKCFAVTQRSLTPVPAAIDLAANSVSVRSALGENVFLAIVRDGNYLVGFPSKGPQDLFQLTQEHLARVKDFYNDRSLIAVMISDSGNELYSLVNLRRRYAETNFGDIGGEWDNASGGIVEPWRLSIWRWRYDKQNNELVLTARGTFNRLIFKPGDKTPRVKIEENLWISIEK